MLTVFLLIYVALEIASGRLSLNGGHSRSSYLYLAAVSTELDLYHIEAFLDGSSWCHFMTSPTAPV